MSQPRVMANRPCLTSGCRGIARKGPRCPSCTRTHDAPRAAAKALRYDRAWTKQSKAMRDAHVAAYGWTCPGWRVPPHPSHDLVVDHDEGVMCRGCNSRKAALLDRG